MLSITLSAFEDQESITLNFEHSLVSLSKWESLHKKPFFSKNERTVEETSSYIKCMLLTDNVPDDFLNRLSRSDVMAITDYINDKQSATWFRENKSKQSSEIITSELIYYWLVQFRIPFEVQYWHLNRLMTLIHIAGIKQTKPKPMTKAEQARQAAEYRRLNEERRARLGTSG